MNKADMVQLERDLTGDLVHQDKAILERVRKLVREFLLHEAGLIANARPKDEKAVLELIGLHARVNLLRTLIENPKAIPPKDLKELMNDGRVAAESDGKKVDPLSMVNALDIPAAEKAALVGGMVDLMRKQLSSGGRSESS